MSEIAYINSTLRVTDMWEYGQKHGSALYKLDRGISTQAVFDSTARKVSKLFDQTLYENNADKQLLLINLHYVLKQTKPIIDTI